MINVKLGIIGDPAFIKQDDVYYSPQSKGYDQFSITNDKQQPITPGGQIIFDTSQVFVQLLVGGAIDIDDNTGITNKGSTTGPEIKLLNGRKLNSSFSGVYKVITVESTLSGGAFTQTLDLIKMPNSSFSDASTTSQDNKFVIPGLQGGVTSVLAGQQDDGSRTAPSSGLFANDIAQIVNDIDTAGLLAAAEQAPDGVFPIVNGAGTTPVEPVVTESSPVNVNDSVAFNGQIVNNPTG